MAMMAQPCCRLLMLRFCAFSGLMSLFFTATIACVFISFLLLLLHAAARLQTLLRRSHLLRRVTLRDSAIFFLLLRVTAAADALPRLSLPFHFFADADAVSMLPAHYFMRFSAAAGAAALCRLILRDSATAIPASVFRFYADFPLTSRAR